MNQVLSQELIAYLIVYCRDWMLTHEIQALRRIGITKEFESKARELASKDKEYEKLMGFQNPLTNDLCSVSEEELELKIAKRVFKDHEKEVINNCPKCHKLARTPKAQQCRHCGYSWR